MEGISEDRIILEYKTSDPIDLELLSSSFAGLANQYRRAMDRLDMESEKTNVRLLITRIEEGSIEVEIGVAAVAFLHAFQFMDYSIIFSDFTIRIKSILDYFAKGAERPTNLDRSDCRDIKSFIGAVEGSKDGSLAYRHAKFHRKTKERETLIEFSFDTLSLRRAAANIEKEVEDIDTKERPSFKTVPNVLSAGIRLIKTTPRHQEQGAQIRGS